MSEQAREEFHSSTRMVFCLSVQKSCAPQKVDPALIPQVRPTIVGYFWPFFFFADHRGSALRIVLLNPSVSGLAGGCQRFCPFRRHGHVALAPISPHQAGKELLDARRHLVPSWRFPHFECVEV